MAEREVCAENKGNEAGRGGRQGRHEEAAPIPGSEELLILRKKDTFMREIVPVATKMDCMR